MQKLRNIILRYYLGVLALFAIGSLFLLPLKAFSDNPYNDTGFDFEDKKSFDIKPEKAKSIQLEADQVQFSQDNNKATASGNVVVTSGKTTMTAEKIELEKNSGQGTASGHVYIDAADMQVDADTAKFNFTAGTGEFHNARIFRAPFQIKGETVAKVSETHMMMQDGFMTTCDLDEPHFRLATRQMDIYPGDKAVARGVTMFLGKVPVMYFAKYVQDLKNKPIFFMTPGYEKDFGAFLLTELRLKLSERVKVVIHGDVRERTGFGEGVDVKYETPNFGAGVLKTYYTYENRIAAKHVWNQRDRDGQKKGPTTRHELYKIEWRHRWQVDKDTNVMWQYYKIHDIDLVNMGFLKRYFEREYRRGPDVNTYFLLTRNLPKGTLTYRMTASRVNRTIQTTDYMPEIKYDLGGQRIGDTNFYFKTADTFSNIRNGADSNNHLKTMRVDTNNEISYPKKIGFIETRPFVGGSHTYYTRTKDLNERNVIRGQFKTGIDIATHFYRVWNYSGKLWGMEINKLRHVVTPSVTYNYAHWPTKSASHFNQFDGIDALARVHSLHLSLEHKLQTKRNNKSVDLLRVIFDTDYSLIQQEPGRNFGPYLSKIEFKPVDWLTLNADGSYNGREDYWNTANFDAYINGGEKWSFGIGKRFEHHANDQLTTELIYKINPKWKFKIYERFYLNGSVLKEENYLFTRDLHEWEMDFNFHKERGRGAGFFIVFRLKAFPDMALDLLSSSFHQPKAGSQSSSGL